MVLATSIRNDVRFCPQPRLSRRNNAPLQASQVLRGTVGWASASDVGADGEEGPARQVRGQDPGRLVALDAPWVWGGGGRTRQVPGSPRRQGRLCEGTSTWAETEWLSRNWPCFLAAPTVSAQCVAAWLCGSVAPLGALSGSVWLRWLWVWHRADSGRGHKPRLTAAPALSARQPSVGLAAPGRWPVPPRTAVSPGGASAGLLAEWHPLGSWVHFCRTTGRGQSQSWSECAGSGAGGPSVPGPAGAASTPLPGKPAAPHWEMTNDQKINL